MHHRALLSSSILAAGCLAGAGVGALAEPEQAWQVTGLDGPESAVLDPDQALLYVSNVNGEPTAADGNGYLAKLSHEGEIQEQEWVTGLTRPRASRCRTAISTSRILTSWS